MHRCVQQCWRERHLGDASSWAPALQCGAVDRCSRQALRDVCRTRRHRGLEGSTRRAADLGACAGVSVIAVGALCSRGSRCAQCAGRQALCLDLTARCVAQAVVQAMRRAAWL